MRFKFFIIIYSLTFSAQSQVSQLLIDQVTKNLKDSDLVYFNKGVTKFNQEYYLEAIPFFEKVLQKNNNSHELNYITGICYSYDAVETQKALKYFYNAGNEAKKFDGYYFNLAYAYEKNDSILQAIENYKYELVIEEKIGNSDQIIKEINYRLNRCKKINEFKTKQNLVKISNIGKPVNSDAAEYCPLITSNESTMIFTYRGPKSKGGKQKMKGQKTEGAESMEIFYEDIFIASKINDSIWSEPKPIDNLNTLLHDAAVSLSPEGNQLFIYRNNGAGKGDLYLSTLVNNVFTKPVYQAGLNSHEWDGSACFIPYQQKIIFASERKGGYGGKDLYIAEKIKNNTWGNIKNLGPEINTKYDEDAPFVTTDGKILFFSSNNQNSFGGYDVFRCDLKNDVWKTPFNLGAPINTKNDDKYFSVRADGKIGYYSSYKQGGKGAQDIYKIEPGIPGIPIEMLEVHGLVNLDGKPVSAEIEINSVLRSTKFSNQTKSNKSDGNFITNLPAGDRYEVIVKLDKFPQQVIELNTIGIDSFVVLNVFAEFNSAEYDKKLDELLNSKTIYIPTDFSKEDFATKFGNTKKDELRYKVQIGAYKILENFNYNNVMGFPTIIRQTDNDYITRFVMGNYETFNDAQELINRMKKANVLKDAFILAEYKGEKKYLNQLIEQKIIE